MICERDTAFDVLALLCSLLNKEDERKCEIMWQNAEEEHIRDVIKKYDNFVEMVLESSSNEYKFNKDLISLVNAILEELNKKADIQDEIFHLAIAVEQSLVAYSGYLNNTVFHAVTPLNNNTDETSIEIFPRTVPFWNLDKSERKRAHTLNTHFKNYMIIRKEDKTPFELDMYYWDDSGLVNKTESEMNLSIALSPIMDYAELDTSTSESKRGNVITVDGVKNKEAVTKRVLGIFEKLFYKKYGIIVFTECLGTLEIIDEIKKRMRMHPEICTLVVLPTICENGQNTLIVLGPGGTQCLTHNKSTPFLLIDEDGVRRQEQLEYQNHIPILITKELGMVAFPICAEFLEPSYYKVMTEAAMADTIICPLFSPGIQAFIDTMRKGTAIKILQLYVNTCSSKKVSRNKTAPEPLVAVHLPYITPKGSGQKDILTKIQKKCKNDCSEMLCYFEVLISYNMDSQEFYIKTDHCLCA